MGVFGLWDILLTTAQKTQIQKLSGKVLAIDASIWLVKAESVFGEDSQKIRIILQKIIYLRKNNILPIFVFDGISPVIKRKTLQKRRQRMRQGSQIDIRKRTEIEVMHLLQNGQKKHYIEKQSTKEKKIIQKQEQIKEIEKLLGNLTQIQAQKSNELGQQDFKKIRLQSEVLTYKYHLLMEDPRLEGLEIVSLVQFANYEIEQKLEYLTLIEHEMWNSKSRQNKRQQISELSKLTPEEKVYYQMQKIQKKMKLRKLQDELYRKTLMNQSKIENGYEIIQQVRNGKKMVMKRKIREQKQHYMNRGNKKLKNDFSVIMNFKIPQQNQNQQCQGNQDDQLENEPDPFLMSLFGKKDTKQKQDKSQSISSSFHPQIHAKPRKLITDKEQIKQKSKPPPQKTQAPKQKIERIREQPPKRSSTQNFLLQRYEIMDDDLDNEEPQSLEPGIQESTPIQPIADPYNPDNMPAFINYQNLSIRHLDSENHRNIEFQKLLDMIGIPYIKAPSEAEAQCAHFQLEGIVDGVVTEDSDTFLFGGKNVFRGVFNDNIRYFSAHKIFQKLKLNREKLIIFALLLGSDYTDGVKGIGIVNAMEILKIFSTFDKLTQFKKWARYADILHADEQNKTEKILKDLSDDQQKQFYQFHKRFKNYWHISDDFPKRSVIKAYFQPQVIDNARLKQIKQQNHFELKEFQEEAVRVFMKQRILLTYSQVDLFCKILKKPFKRGGQSNITDYFPIGQDHSYAIIKSKRLLKALNQGNQKSEDEQQDLEI